MRIVIALGRQRAAAARAADDGGEPAGQHPAGGRTDRRDRPRQRDRRRPRQRPPGRAAGLAGGGLPRRRRPYPLDVLGAQTEAMIGYVIEQELGNLLPFEQPFATVLTMIEVDPRRSRVRQPDQADRTGLRQGRPPSASRPSSGWTIAPDGDKYRRVVASPKPQAHLRDPADPDARRAGHHRDLRRRRRHPDDVRRATASCTASRPSSTRTSRRRCWPSSSTPTCW